LAGGVGRGEVRPGLNEPDLNLLEIGHEIRPCPWPCQRASCPERHL
jgi:hypothetical protein